jgi:hypothetical protein
MNIKKKKKVKQRKIKKTKQAWCEPSIFGSELVKSWIWVQSGNLISNQFNI